MYCRNCGKFIDGDEQLCEVCKQAAAPVGGSNPRMLAFKPSLAAVITGVIGFVFMMMAYIYAFGGVAAKLGGLAEDIDNAYTQTYGTGLDPEMFITLAWVLFVMAIPLCIVALVFGIRSLMTVVRAKKSGAPMAIAPLILSICAIGAAALTVIFGLIALFLLASM